MRTSFPIFRDLVHHRSSFALAVVLSLAAATRVSAQAVAAPTAAPGNTPGNTPIDAASTDPGWLKVETLELGKRLHVNTKQHTHVDCIFAKADAETLTCGGVVFQKAEIQSIKPSHRTRSTFVGLGVGYGAAIGLSVAAYGGSTGNHIVGSDRCNSAACIITVALVDLTLVIATPILFHVYDLTATAIYKAP